MSPRAANRGVTLIELLIATAIGSMLLAALTSMVTLGLDTRTAGAAANEQIYRATFALERLVSKTHAAGPKFLAAKAADTTGEWLAPLMFCLSASAKLIETTTDDSGCTGGTALADGVTAFSALAAASPGPVDIPIVTYALTVAAPAAAQPVTLTASARLGGGTR